MKIQTENYKYIINVRDNIALRDSFNKLVQDTFCFNFDDWYQKGYWGNKYIPHVLVDNGKVIANVSVNELDFQMNHEKKRLIQIGTVMTDREYRMQGLGKKIMENVLDEYCNKVDGIYLFGNDSVLQYYPKFGFKKYEQYQYYKTLNDKKRQAKKSNDFFKRVNMKDESECNKVIHAIQNNVSTDKVLLLDNSDLDMFYLAGPMAECVYEIPSHKAFIVMDQENACLEIAQIFADHPIDTSEILEEVSNKYGGQVKEITLGFTPMDTTGWISRLSVVEDCTFWGMGDIFENFESDKLLFPTLSHA